MHSAKSFLRRVLEHVACTPIRFLIDLLGSRRSRRVLDDSCARFGWKALNLQVLVNLRERKNSDTLYILGSGSSVNQVSDEMWDQIAGHVSVGINHWTLHKFVPDVYAVEPVPDSRRDVGRSVTSLEVDHLNHLRLLDRSAVYKSEAIVICLAPRTVGENAQVMELPERLRDRMYMYFRFTPFTRMEKNIADDYGRFLNSRLDRTTSLVGPDSGATLVRLLGIAVKTGFKHVVLVGVDLSTTYFWQEKGANLVEARYHAFSQPMTGKVHETVLTNNRPFSVLSVLSAYSRLLRGRGVGLEVWSPTPELLHAISSESAASS